MEDIDKDIETIWKELQELDKLPRSENGLVNRRKDERYWLITFCLHIWYLGTPPKKINLHQFHSRNKSLWFHLGELKHLLQTEKYQYLSVFVNPHLLNQELLPLPPQEQYGTHQMTAHAVLCHRINDYHPQQTILVLFPKLTQSQEPSHQLV